VSSLVGGLGAVSGSSALELLLLLESGSAGFGGGLVGNGCCVALLDGVVVGVGVSGGAAGFTSPGNGCCSAADLGGCRVQGLAV
jgi:hypothetical protein